MIDGLGNANDALSFAELIPSLNTFLSSSSAMSSVISGASFAGILLFPVAQLINLVNANQTGQRMYSYRSIAYTITAWSFAKPIPTQSARVMRNISSGSIQKSSAEKMEYQTVWRNTSKSVVDKLNLTCSQKSIPKPHLQAIFRALGSGQMDKLCLMILEGFEKEFSPTTKNIWKSTYSIRYGQ